MSIMVFYGDDQVPSGTSRSHKRFAINGPNAEQIHYPDLDAAGLEFVVGFQCLEQSYSRSNNQHPIILPLPDYLGPADLELLFRSVNDGIVGTAQADIGGTDEFRSQHGRRPGAGCITGVKHGEIGFSREHRNIFQTHLRRTVLPNRNAYMGAA